jgi:hypothetical protein
MLKGREIKRKREKRKREKKGEISLIHNNVYCTNINN